jgi:hypothetical protein
MINSPGAPAAVNALNIAREIGAEETVILGVDPQRRNANRLAKKSDSSDQPLFGANGPVRWRSAAAGEVDDAGKARRRKRSTRQ